MGSNYPYDPYASPNDPAYSPVSGPSWDAEYNQLKAMGYTDKQIAAMQSQQQQLQTSGGSTGPSWAQQQSAAQFGQSLAEQQRQFDLARGDKNGQFDRQFGFDQAIQKWKEAVDARDFQASEYWKARAQELQQNHLALDYTNLLASKSGPQDWITYNRLSRQESPLGTPDGKTVPLDQALPAWARGFAPGSYPDSSGKNASAFFGGGAAGTGAAAGGAAKQGGLLDLTKSSVGNPAYSQPAWAAGMTSTPTKTQVGIGNGMFGAGTTFGVGEGGVPISLSDWALKNLGTKAAS